ncbi:MAG: translation initiation factor eIF-2B [Gammaproteobacteria bacterium]|nr:translation initiation factor eIF-2B [Gammaproteobacteria bacterium]NIR85272.1 translation initiation factor eIF-2B [Gammaproteobacteria bacterium]NIR88388.1 translation initiation factor eIF-2B [Gammaproteobacteria bacterium]NIU06338.1 translation initiation factor eIF-2B [Gammaproteobacteria bacterium]NIV53237.1 translation initiation factor IF-2B subunit alpha [Gammaproteobacteria bacterium]
MNTEQIEREGLAEIAHDRERGASELARRSLALLAAYVREHAHAPSLREDARGFARKLRATRPSMAPVQNLVAEWMASLDEMPDAQDDAPGYLAGQADSLIERSRRAVTEAATHAVQHLAPQTTIITHSSSSTIREIFRLAAPRVGAIVTESRPLREGVALARHLSALAVPTTYITDAQIAAFIGAADVAVIGADTVLWDGSVVNKAGSRLLALAARDAGVPFYVCCESFKLSRTLPHEATLEEMAPEELDAPALAHVTARNVYFDVTPARLVSGWITERGMTADFRDADWMRAGS